jgi:polyisoprenoid-binding protein YceI
VEFAIKATSIDTDNEYRDKDLRSANFFDVEKFPEITFKQGRETAKGGFATSVTLNRKDFGITWNRAVDSGGFVLGDDVTIEINIEANKQIPGAS